MLFLRLDLRKLLDGSTDQCISDPCINGGTCVEGVLGYICMCPTLYNGQNCELNSTGEITLNFLPFTLFLKLNSRILLAKC